MSEAKQPYSPPFPSGLPEPVFLGDPEILERAKDLADAAARPALGIIGQLLAEIESLDLSPRFRTDLPVGTRLTPERSPWRPAALLSSQSEADHKREALERMAKRIADEFVVAASALADLVLDMEATRRRPDEATVSVGEPVMPEHQCNFPIAVYPEGDEATVVFGAGEQARLNDAETQMLMALAQGDRDGIYQCDLQELILGRPPTPDNFEDRRIFARTQGNLSRLFKGRVREYSTNRKPGTAQSYMYDHSYSTLVQLRGDVVVISDASPLPEPVDKALYIWTRTSEGELIRQFEYTVVGDQILVYPDGSTILMKPRGEDRHDYGTKRALVLQILSEAWDGTMKGLIERSEIARRAAAQGVAITDQELTDVLQWIRRAIVYDGASLLKNPLKGRGRGGWGFLWYNKVVVNWQEGEPREPVAMPDYSKDPNREIAKSEVDPMEPDPELPNGVEIQFLADNRIDIKGYRVELTDREYALFAAMAKYKGRTVGTEEVIEIVRQHPAYAGLRTRGSLRAQITPIYRSLAQKINGAMKEDVPILREVQLSTQGLPIFRRMNGNAHVVLYNPRG